MARLQSLELPEGSGDDRPPFVLVIDQADDDLYADLAPTDTDGHEQSRSAHLVEQLGARAVLCFHGTIDIPANDTSAVVEGEPFDFGEELKRRLRVAYEKQRGEGQDGA